MLDEAANICKIADLPQQYSHLGSRGVIPVTILQSYPQGEGVWGQTGMQTMWAAATVKVVGASMDDDRFASLLVAFLLTFSVATLQQTGAVSVPGISQTEAAHADDEYGWVPCVAGWAAQWGQWGFVAYEWSYGADWELGSISIWFSVYVSSSVLTGYEFIYHVLGNDNDTCYVHTQTQQGNFIVGDTAPQYGGYATFECQWE